MYELCKRIGILKRFLISFNYFYVYICGCVHMNASAHGVQKRTVDLHELELQVVVNFLTWVLGRKIGSFTIAV